MYIYVKTKKTFYIPKSCVKMTNYGVWNNVHHSIHCNTFGKTDSCSSYTKLLYDKARKVMCCADAPCRGIKKKKTIKIYQKKIKQNMLQSFCDGVFKPKRAN